MSEKKDATPEAYALRALCNWRASSRAKKGAKGLPDDRARLAIGARHYRNEQALELAADEYMNVLGMPP